MFFIIFGLLWMAISSYIIYGFYSPGQSDTIIFNNEVVTYEEFSQLLWPKLVLGFVFLLGLIIFLAGLSIVIKNYRTSKRGKSAIGVLVDVKPNGQTVNDSPLYDGFFLVFEENNVCKSYHENIGANYYDYPVGSFYEVKYFNNDINIISRIDEKQIPSDKLQIIQNVVYTHSN